MHLFRKMPAAPAIRSSTGSWRINPKQKNVSKNWSSCWHNSKRLSYLYKRANLIFDKLNSFKSLTYEYDLRCFICRYDKIDWLKELLNFEGIPHSTQQEEITNKLNL